MTKTKKPVKVPIHGKADHNMAFHVSIGGLIINWSNNESVFLAMLQALVRGGPLSAAVIWHSHRTSIARIELVMRLCRERVKNGDLLEDLTKAAERFKNLSRTRNFYCHATYRYDSNLCLSHAQGITTLQEGKPISFEDKRMDRATLNEINRVSLDLGELNAALWSLVRRLHNELEVPLPEQLSPLAELKSDQGDQARPDAREAPEDPQSSPEQSGT